MYLLEKMKIHNNEESIPDSAKMSNIGITFFRHVALFVVNAGSINLREGFGRAVIVGWQIGL